MTTASHDGESNVQSMSPALYRHGGVVPSHPQKYHLLPLRPVNHQPQ